MNAGILFVDDDPHLLSAIQRTLRKRFTIALANGPREALEVLQKSGPFAVIVADARMPGMDGTKLLEHVRRISPDTVRLMLTGNAEQQTAADAVNRGQIFRFLNKPCPPEHLVTAIETALQQYELQRVERELLEGTLTCSVKALTDVLALVVPEAHARGQCLREYIGPFAAAAGAGPLWELETAALLSPLGYTSIPANVLRKLAARAPLAVHEESMVQRHPQVGHDLLVNIPRLQSVANIVLHQHKHFEGGGFPATVCSRESIPVGARLLKILHDRLELEKEGIIRQLAQSTMAARNGVYDPALLELSFTCLPDPLLRPPNGERAPLALSIRELAAGQRLAANVLTPDGLVLVGAGNELTPMMVERLRNLAELGEVSEPFLVEDLPPPASPETPASAEPEPAATQ